MASPLLICSNAKDSGLNLFVECLNLIKYIMVI